MSKQNSPKSRKVVGFTILAIVFTLAIGAVIMIPSIVDKLEERANDEILENMENIYTSAIIIEEIDVGLHEDSDNDGKYEKLSEMSGFRVYNVPEKNKYSVMKDYRSGKIKVYYGEEKLVYPEEKEDEIEVESEIDPTNIQNEDLFNYDESTGDIIVTGFSEDGVSLLGTDNAIQIPETYKGREVVEIAEKAFYNKGIEGVVVIGDNIKKIGDNAFTNNGLKGASDSIDKPGRWIVEDKEWIKVK